MTDEAWMLRALGEAELAAEHADVPIGCVIIDSHATELARAHNRREVDHDPTAHAEILALRLAAERRRHWRLDDCTVFVTLEPCAMCAGALVNARVARLVFGAHDPKAGAVASLFELGRDVRLNHRFPVAGGLLADRAASQLQAFFRELRAAGER
jgi:tRNA(adenine34) deaminase